MTRGRGHAGLSSAPRVTRGQGGGDTHWALGRGAQWSHNGAWRGQLVLVLVLVPDNAIYCAATVDSRTLSSPSP